MKTLFFSFLLFLTSLTASAHTLTEQRVNHCLSSQTLSIISQAESFKNQGIPKRTLLENLNPSLDEETLNRVKRALNFVYDEKHEVSASVHGLVKCLQD